MKESSIKQLIKEAISEVFEELQSQNNLPPKEVLDFLIKIYMRDTGSDLDSASRYIKNALKRGYRELNTDHNSATFNNVVELGITTTEDRIMFSKILKKSYPKPNNVLMDHPSENPSNPYRDTVTITFPKTDIKEVMTTKAVAPKALTQLIVDRLSVKTAKPQNQLWSKIEQHLTTQGKWLKSHKTEGDYEYNSTTVIWEIPQEAFFNMSYKEVENVLNGKDSGDDSDFSRDEESGEPIAGMTYSKSGKFKVSKLGSSYKIIYEKEGGIDI